MTGVQTCALPIFADYLKVDVRTVYRMVKSKQLPAFKVRNQWRFKKETIDKWIEGNNIDSTTESKIDVPIIGRVSAGQPILAEENIEGALTVDDSLVKNPDKVFALRVTGNSMINAGVLDRDFVLIHRQVTAEDGEIVVALIEDEVTIKKFYKDKNSNKIILQPANDTMDPIYIDPSDSRFMILGKMKGVIRKV